MPAFRNKIRKGQELEAKTLFTNAGIQIKDHFHSIILPALLISIYLSLANYMKLLELSEYLKLDFLYPDMIFEFISGLPFYFRPMMNMFGIILVFLYLYHILNISVIGTVNKLRFKLAEVILLIILPYILILTLLTVSLYFTEFVSPSLMFLIVPLIIIIYCRWGIIFIGAVLAATEMNITNLKKMVEVSYVFSLGHKNKIFTYWFALSIAMGFLQFLPWIGMLFTVIFINSLVICAYLELKNIFKINNNITNRIDPMKISMKTNIFKELFFLLILVIIAIGLELTLIFVK